MVCLFVLEAEDLLELFFLGFDEQLALVFEFLELLFVLGSLGLERGLLDAVCGLASGRFGVLEVFFGEASDDVVFVFEERLVVLGQLADFVVLLAEVLSVELLLVVGLQLDLVSEVVQLVLGLVGLHDVQLELLRELSLELFDLALGLDDDDVFLVELLVFLADASEHLLLLAELVPESVVRFVDEVLHLLLLADADDVADLCQVALVLLLHVLVARVQLADVFLELLDHLLFLCSQRVGHVLAFDFAGDALDLFGEAFLFALAAEAADEVEVAEAGDELARVRDRVVDDDHFGVAVAAVLDHFRELAVFVRQQLLVLEDAQQHLLQRRHLRIEVETVLELLLVSKRTRQPLVAGDLHELHRRVQRWEVVVLFVAQHEVHVHHHV